MPDVEYHTGEPVLMRFSATGSGRIPEIFHEYTQAVIDNGIVAGYGGIRVTQAVNRGGA
jgi:hypothetical protein